MRHLLAAVGIVASAAILFATPTDLIDLRADWPTAKAIADGIDPSQPMSDFSGNYGVDLMPTEARAPRSPGSLMLTFPLAVVTLEAFTNVGRLILLAQAVALAWLAARYFKWDPLKAIALLPAYFMWIGGMGLIVTGNHEMIVAASILIALLGARRGDPWWAGLLLGATTALKVWPWAVAALLLMSGKRRIALGAVGSFVVLNAVGLLLPGVTLAGTLEALRSGSQFVGLPNNGSFPGWLTRWGVPATAATVVCQLALIAAVLRSGRLRLDLAIIVMIPVAVLLNPLGWAQALTSVGLTLIYAWLAGDQVTRLIVAVAWIVGYGWILNLRIEVLVSTVLALAVVAAMRVREPPALVTASDANS